MTSEMVTDAEWQAEKARRFRKTLRDIHRPIATVMWADCDQR